MIRIAGQPPQPINFITHTLQTELKHQHCIFIKGTPIFFSLVVTFLFQFFNPVPLEFPFFLFCSLYQSVEYHPYNESKVLPTTPSTARRALFIL